VVEADLTAEHRPQARLQLPHPPPDRHPISRRALGHVAVVPDPVDRGIGAGLFPEVGRSKAGSQAGEEQLLLVDLVAEAHQILGQLGPRSLALDD